MIHNMQYHSDAEQGTAAWRTHTPLEHKLGRMLDNDISDAASTQSCSLTKFLLD